MGSVGILKMRIQVQIAGECIAVSILSKDAVSTLCEEAVTKLRKLRPDLKEMVSGGLDTGSNFSMVKEIRKIPGGALLDPDDKVHDILRDGEFVCIDLKHELSAAKRRQSVVLRPGPKVVHTPGDSLFGIYAQPALFVKPTETLVLDGNSLTTDDLVKCGRGLYKIEIAPYALERIRKSRHMLQDIVNENRVVYGVTTGFGNFANVVVSPQNLLMSGSAYNVAVRGCSQLQTNVIRSHACGVGPPLPPSRARMLLALRLNVLAKGYAGVAIDTVEKLVKAFNEFCVSWIPQKGTVGCSGDLAPLAHLALGLIGEGRMWSPETGWDDAAKVLATHGIEPLCLGPKEGIALINGTQMVTALGAEAVERAQAIAYQADVIAALTLDVLKGTTKAFDAGITTKFVSCFCIESTVCKI